MSSPIDVDIVNEAAKRATAEVLDYLTILVPMNLGPQGQTYGTKTMSREDRVLAFMEDAQSGALDFLFTVNEQFAKDYVDQFNRDVMASPVMRSDPRVAAMAQNAENMIPIGGA